MRKRKKNTIALFMLSGVVSLYIFLFFIDKENAIHALQEAFVVLKLVLPIIVVVFFLMGLVNISIDKEKISRYFGKESGIKGWFYAIIAGVLSHGPAYVWYPFLQNLREHGAKDSLVFAFLYARSIKIPWIPLMISYFGWAFTLFFSFYIVVASILQGLIVEAMQKR